MWVLITINRIRVAIVAHVGLWPYSARSGFGMI